MSLQAEIDKSRSTVKTDGYSMSVGEWISLYENREIDVHPEFQRFFRWTPQQKSRLIESILIGIPIPPIFVAQREDGVWDVVDGLQRLSTIFEFAGILKDEDGKTVPPLVLEETKYLPSLKSMKWNDEDHPGASLTPTQRLLIKRSKIPVSIILRESDEASKYELFQRLNTGGSPLSQQEVRNSILVMTNRPMHKWLLDLSQDPDFIECTALTDRELEERYDMELVLRFIVFRNMRESELRKVGDVGDFLTDRMIELAKQPSFSYGEEEEAFRTTFELLKQSLGDVSFRKFNKEKDRFIGGFLISGYEAVALGIGCHFRQISASRPDIKAVIKDIWSDDAFASKTAAGLNATSRMLKTIPVGREKFQPK